MIAGESELLIRCTACDSQKKYIMYTPSSSPVNCSDPTLPGNGFIESYQNTTEGAEIVFRCNSGFVPNRRMAAVCVTDGMWNPDPATLLCTCE